MISIFIDINSGSDNAIGATFLPLGKNSMAFLHDDHHDAHLHDAHTACNQDIRRYRLMNPAHSLEGGKSEASSALHTPAGSLSLKDVLH